MANYPRGFAEPPFGITVIWGKRKVGKTIAALNSPWLPVHIIDDEFSAKDYQEQWALVQELGLIKNPFTRESCLTDDSFAKEAKRIIKGKETYGTLILDTAGQITTWLATRHFKSVSPSKAEKMSQVVWGEVRDKLRDLLLQLQLKTKLIILTAHEREYAGVKSPRANPAILELASLSIRLEKSPNQKIPDGIVDVARLPVYPPKIPQFTISKLLTYHKKPADWDELKEDERVEDTTPPPISPEPE
jgi:hypothetical protein